MGWPRDARPDDHTRTAGRATGAGIKVKVLIFSTEIALLLATISMNNSENDGIFYFLLK
jgi:hypothetical protein